MRNLRLAFRTLIRTPFVTTIAVLSLALGIGANAAIYSLFNEMLLAPLPVPHPEQLVDLGGNTVNPGSQSCGQEGDCNVVFSYPMFRDLERAATQFSGVAAHVDFGANVAMKGITDATDATLVSGSYFPVLGVRPALGRLISPQDDDVIGGHPLADLSYGYWQTHLGGDPGVLNQPIIVNGHTFTIIGVTAQGFDGTTLGNRPDVYVPITMRASLGFDTSSYNDRRDYWAYLFARVKPGVTTAQATASANVVYHRIITEVEAPLQKGLSAATLDRFKKKTLTLEDGRRGQSSLHEQTKTPLLLLMAVTLIVLLIACANIANLLLVRAAGRSLEMGVRLSIGATRGQLLAQLLTESVLLAALGGIAGIAVAYVTLKGIVAILPVDVASSLTFTLSGAALGFAALLALVTGVLFGLFPALHSTRPDLVTTLRNNSGKISATRGARRFRTSLVTAQIALALTLMVGAGLLIQSLRKISQVDLGLHIDNVVMFRIAPVRNGYTPERTMQLYTQLEDALRALPGVTHVSAGRVPLLSGNNWGNDVGVQGFKKTPDTDANSRYNEIAPGYFALLQVPLIAGREFTASDAIGTPNVAVVNEAFAKKFGLGHNAVGKLMDRGNDSLDIQIVGLVKDAGYSNVKQDVPPVFFLPYRQDKYPGQMTFYVRSPAAAEAMFPRIRAVVASFDRNLPISSLKTLPQEVRDNVFLDRMIGMLSTAFAALATMLAAIGLYGVLSYSVAQRTREIGVRMALGADGSRILTMVLRQVATMTVVGLAIGAAGALALGRGAQSLLFEIKGHDPVVLIVSVVALGVVATLAGLVPALRASRVDPTHALRYE